MFASCGRLHVLEADEACCRYCICRFRIRDFCWV